VDQTQIIAPPGQSGQPGHAHYDDMVERWLDGKLIDLPVNREQVRKMAALSLKQTMGRCAERPTGPLAPASRLPLLSRAPPRPSPTPPTILLDAPPSLSVPLAHITCGRG
jgi:hypothetical protein